MIIIYNYSDCALAKVADADNKDDFVPANKENVIKIKPQDKDVTPAG